MPKPPDTDIILKDSQSASPAPNAGTVPGKVRKQLPLSRESQGALKRAFLDHLLYCQGKSLESASKNDLYQALARTVRDQLVQSWFDTTATYQKHNARTVAYLSAEFLVGPYLGNTLLNLGLTHEARLAMHELGLDLDELLRQEEEPGLGNGGLGRLAACFIESLATLMVPTIGYGIRYEYGIFYQTLQQGWQVENTDLWLRFGNPWEIQQAEWTVQVKLGGHTESYTDDKGRFRARWIPEKTVAGVPFDSPIPGYRVGTTNTLRLWRADATTAFNLHIFNQGDYLGAISQQATSENLTKVLYPSDESPQGKELRLEQQYFFVSCSLQDMLRLHRQRGQTVTSFHQSFAIQLNDTHPAIGIAELMRLLVDEYLVPWDQAWQVTHQTFSYTNHTLLPEALERWSVELLGKVLPRHLEIIYEINARFLNQARVHFPADDARMARLSLIDETGNRYVRMAHLASVGSHAINGVAALHSELLKQNLLKDFYTLWPENFHSITNGVTPRRWVALSNPRLSQLLTRCLGKEWIKDWSQVAGLKHYADDSAFNQEWRAVKYANKVDLARVILHKTGISVDPHSMFDVQVKRIHEYKRQHLSALHIAALYHQLKSHPHLDIVPRTFIFGGKAAPGYVRAKLMIKLITAIGDVVNHDPEVRDRLRVVFLPNYSVTLGQVVYPAAELSEQISLAGFEASGTGNMKFTMNGALTLGTLDGANIEIREAVGADQFFLFGLTAKEVAARTAAGYRPKDDVAHNAELQAVLELIRSGYFSRGDSTLFAPLVDDLLHHDPYMVLADYTAYAACQNQVDDTYRNPQRWNKMSILNTARSGKFSSDRAVREYCDQIWKTHPVPVA
jgi:starch phosphorylase